MHDFAAQFRMARVILPIISGCMMIGAFISGVETAIFVSNAKQTTGTIVLSDTMNSTDSGTLYRPKISFDAKGKEFTLTPQSFVSESPGRVGEQVAILYDDRNPNRARIDSFIYLWATAAILFWGAVVNGCLALGLNWFHRRDNQTEPEVG